MKRSKLMKQTLKKYYPFILILIILLLTHLKTLVTNDGMMIFFGDSYEQQLQFYLGGWERLHNLDFSLWDWSLGYGANYFSHVFYFATSPFFFITLFFSKTIIPYLFIYLNMLKLFLIFYFTYLWLGKLTCDKIARTIGAFVLTFSGWVIFFYHYNHFLDAFLLYPLILFGIEEYLQDSKISTYSIALAVLGIINYYFLYMFILFIFLYTLFRYFVLNRKFDYKHFFQSFLTVFLYSLIGIGLSAFILLPSVINILGAPRIQSLETSNLFALISRLDVFRYVSSIFSPVVQRFDPTAYISISSDSGIGWSGGVSLYSSIIFPFAFMQIFTIKDKREKYLLLGLYSFLLLLATFTFSYKLLQGSLDVRWFYMFTLLNVYIIVRYLSSVNFPIKLNKQFVGSILFICVFNLLIFAYSYSNQLYATSLNLKFSLIFLSLTILFNLSILYFVKNAHFKKYLLMIVVVESIFTFQLPIWLDPPIKKADLVEFTQPSFNQSAINYLNEMDQGFYRILTDSYVYTSQNDPMARYYKGTSFYESIYNYEQEQFLNRFKSTWSMPVNFGRTNTNFITSVKYYITEEENHLPPYGFDYLTTIENNKIYENRYFIELGFALKDTLNSKTFTELSYLNQDRLFLNYVVTEDSTNKEFTYLDELHQYAQWVYIDRYYLELDTSQNDTLVYVENIDIPVFSVNYIKNSEFYKKETFWQYQYFSIFLDKDAGINAVEIFKENIYDSPNGFNIFVADDLDYYDTWYTETLDNSFYDVVVDKDHITARIDLSKKNTLATSIPFDKGWSVFVDGKQIDYKKVNLGFIGFELDQGNHTIEFKFFPRGLMIGLIISCLSLVTFIILFVFKRFKLNHPVRKSQ